MSRYATLKMRLAQSAALATILLAAGGCSSDGRGINLAMGGGLGASGLDGGSNPSDQGGRPGGVGVTSDNGGLAPTGGGGGGAGGGGGGGPSVGPGPGPGPSGGSDGTVSRILDTSGSLLSTGNAFLNGTPLEGVSDGLLDPILSPIVGPAGTVDKTVNPMARIDISDRPVVGSGAGGSQQALGVSALSNGQATGSLASLGLLTNGNLVSAGASGADPIAIPAPAQLAALTDNPVSLGLNGDTVVGSTGASGKFVNANLLGTDGKLMTASLSGGDLAGAGLLDTANAVLGGLPTGGLPGAAGLLDTANAVLGGVPAVGGLTGGLTGGSNPLGGVVDTVNGALGGAAAVNALNNGSLVSADISGLSGLTGGLPTGGLPDVGGLLGGAAGGLPTGGLPDVGGLIGTVTGALPTGGLPDVGGIVSGVTGALPAGLPDVGGLLGSAAGGGTAGGLGGLLGG